MVRANGWLLSAVVGLLRQWGRDELKAGGMWNSNSVISCVLESAHISEAAGAHPRNGSAPGWNVGLVVAQRQPLTGPGCNSSVCQDRA